MTNENTNVVEEVNVEPVEVEVEVEAKTEPATEEVKSEPVEKKAPKKPAPKTAVGNVSGCEKLRLRELPNTDAKVITELFKDSKLIINKAESTKDFYKVTTATGLTGFCMKKFVTVK